DPPVSVPSPMGAKPAATAAALPQLDPPGTRVTSQGLAVVKNAEFSVDEPMANSSMFVLPMITMPAVRRRATTVASYGGREPSRARGVEDAGNPEPVVLGRRRHRQGRLPVEAGLGFVGAQDVDERQRVGGRRDVGGVESRHLGRVLEDDPQLLGHPLNLLFGE